MEPHGHLHPPGCQKEYQWRVKLTPSPSFFVCFWCSAEWDSCLPSSSLHLDTSGEERQSSWTLVLRAPLYTPETKTPQAALEQAIDSPQVILKTILSALSLALAAVPLRPIPSPAPLLQLSSLVGTFQSETLYPHTPTERWKESRRVRMIQKKPGEDWKKDLV